MSRATKILAAAVQPVSSKKQLLNIEAVRVFLGGISRDSLDRLRNDRDKRFPRPLQILGGTPLWTVEQLERFISREEKVVESVSA